MKASESKLSQSFDKDITLQIWISFHLLPFKLRVLLQVRGKFFYLDANAFADKELLERLSPADPNAVEAAPLNDPNSKQ